MSYITAVRDFLISYDIFALSAALALVWIFGIINFCKNTYRKQNKRFNACRVRLLKGVSPSTVMCSAPIEYRRQWRAFVSSGAERPPQTFEFVPRKNRKSGVILVVLGAVVSCAYLAIFVTDLSRQVYLVFQGAFWLSLTIVLIINWLIFRRKEKRARQHFGKFVAQLSAAVANSRDRQSIDKGGNSVAQQIRKVSKVSAGKDAVAKASEILRQHGLNATRTAYEQRQINYALNGLLQSYARSDLASGANV